MLQEHPTTVTPQTPREITVPLEVPTQSRYSLRRLLRHVGYYFRPLSFILSLTAENPAIFTALLLIPTCLSSAAITFILASGLRPILKGFAVAAAAGIPLAGSLYFYLMNLSRSRRADLAVRARRHSDAAVIAYVCRLITRLQESVCGPNARIAPLRSQSSMFIETNYIRSRALFVRLVLDQAANQFRITREVLEQALGVSAMAMEGRAERRVWLRYHLEREFGTSGLRAEADMIDECATCLRKRADALRNVADDFAKILRFVVKQPSTGRAVAAAARVLSRHLDKESWGTATDLVDLRRGVPITWILGLPHLQNLAPDSHGSLRHHLAFFADFQSATSRASVDKAVDALDKHTPTSPVILTVGYSQMVARVLSILSRRKDMAVGVIIPEQQSEWDSVVFAEEDRSMETELLVEEKLRGRVFRTTVGGLQELSVDWQKVFIVMGGEAVTFDGTVLHPRGRLGVHRALEQYVTKASKPRRFVICESYKAIDVPPEARTVRMLSSITTGDYDVLVTDQGVFEGAQRDALQGLRAAWRASVDRRLVDGGKKAMFARSDGWAP